MRTSSQPSQPPPQQPAPAAAVPAQQLDLARHMTSLTMADTAGGLRACWELHAAAAAAARCGACRPACCCQQGIDGER
jgi:hypothetical protein